MKAFRCFGLVEPVCARVANAVEVAHRNVDPVVVVLATSFDEQHAHIAVRRQPIAQQCACCAASYDNVVKCGLAHDAPGRSGENACSGLLQDAPLALWEEGAMCR